MLAFKVDALITNWYLVLNSCNLIMLSCFFFRWATGNNYRNRGRNCQYDESSDSVGFSNWKVWAATDGEGLTQQ